ncbi:hypothetical protein DGMP_11680 [Desulfomarina profundi]|uniref:Reverse transcriptase domain-containing protein n=1 Tax=Desulfomarina profundi TaxID=2772557 RepID=A0A8D5FH03_9BACT|nr:reverse transcriptase domain-containing protein [Desulfomarina profundi]BCL60475.1 hypothetical protein DGMP_11680 [Desulfomarina profundi]
MGKLLKDAASPQVLNHAWKRHKNDKTMWDESVPAVEMRNDLVYHMLQMSKELADGTYQPGSVRLFPVSKGDGRQRIISALTLRDKIAQRAVLTVLEPIAEKTFHHDSFGYRPGRTIDMALSRVREYILCGGKWVVDGDIQQFFDTIPHRPLLKILRRLIPDPELTALIERWLKVGTPRTGFFGKRKGIPQGAILSPLLCNIFLTNFDNHLASRNLSFVRYADDFLIFAPNGKEAHNALGCADQALQQLGLKLHKKKTRVAEAGPGVVFLGKKLPKLRKKIV